MSNKANGCGHLRLVEPAESPTDAPGGDRADGNLEADVEILGQLAAHLRKAAARADNPDLRKALELQSGAFVRVARVKGIQALLPRNGGERR